MVYTCKYKSSIGDILLATDEIGLIGLWFEGQKYFANTLPDEHIPQETEILTETIKWLDMYFSGEEPNSTPPLHPSGSSFRQAVWQILLQIPYMHNMPTAPYELPYEGAKEMLLVDEVDNKEFLTGLFHAMYDELPALKPKKKK